MRVSSSAFQEGKAIPTRYAYPGIPGGKNFSLPLSWEGAPAATRCFALSMVDLHPVAHTWVHWLVLNIPPEATHLPEGASGSTRMPEGSKELVNSYGSSGYGGPQPPKGSGPHTYEVTVYALDTEKIDLPANTSFSAFLRTLVGRVLERAVTAGTFERT